MQTWHWKTSGCIKPPTGTSAESLLWNIVYLTPVILSGKVMVADPKKNGELGLHLTYRASCLSTLSLLASK